MDQPYMVTTTGITKPELTAEPLGTEGEMTPGPDDWNPYDEEVGKQGLRRLERERARGVGDSDVVRTVPQPGTLTASLEDSPTAGDDPFVFDDVAAEVGEVRLPEPGPGPRF